MRYALVFLALSAITACESESLAGPSVAAERPANAGAAAPRIITCRRGLVESGPLYIVDGRIVNDSVARIALPNARNVEVVKSTEAARLYGSRATQGVVMITTRGAESSVVESGVALSRPEL